MKTNPTDILTESRVCLARQPILNLSQSIIGYEMLFRTINSSEANVIDGTAATADIIINLLSNIGLSNVIGNKKAFINFDEHLIQNDVVNILPKDRVVLEVLENVVVDDFVLAQLKSLVQSGYTLAIDDFIDNESTQQLFNLVKILKIDISDYSKDQLKKYAEMGKQHNLQLLAERVETKDEFMFCKELGFELFQGYFFAKPEYIEKQSIPSNKMSIITILNDIMSDQPIEYIQQQVSQDVSLAYKLLRYINSAGLRRDREISNIMDAVQLIGTKPLYRWLSLLLFTDDKNCISESTISLFVTALTRGFFLEYIANQTNKTIANDLFILGIFSYLDTLLKMPFSEILEELYIHDNIKEALLSSSGPYYEYYQLAIENDQNRFSMQDNQLKLSEDTINNANLYAMQAANNLL